MSSTPRSPESLLPLIWLSSSNIITLTTRLGTGHASMAG
eukprot:CAMPEP_0198420362 /NCGR_PEP_ID=MMETSP1452-20131203/857_1 /TAXON_ID=1181717 /ORGANISM="Synchroma pusillum, Strain CCMP3072" /LENGTH=38 /DNA_ID= /DNA_START= /DNA_END= /DNA_ORIENTATION=